MSWSGIEIIHDTQKFPDRLLEPLAPMGRVKRGGSYMGRLLAKEKLHRQLELDPGIHGLVVRYQN